jgi:hypothetical protein
MKLLLKKIDTLTDNIEMGLLTRGQAFSKLRELRSDIADKYEEGSDEFVKCIEPLIDANEVANLL